MPPPAPNTARKKRYPHNPINIDTVHNISFNVDSKSVSIESFNVQNTQHFNILNSPNFHDVHGLNAIESDKFKLYQILINDITSRTLITLLPSIFIPSSIPAGAT